MQPTNATKGWLAGLEFNGPVNTVKVMSSRSVYLTTLFLDWSSKLEVNQYLCTFICQKLTTAECSSWIRGRGRMTVKKYFIISLHKKKKLPDLEGIKLATSWSPVGCISDWATEALNRRTNKHTYRIWPNYRTYSYKCTVKQFRSPQVTASAVFQLPARPARISHKIRRGRWVLKDVRPPDACFFRVASPVSQKILLFRLLSRDITAPVIVYYNTGLLVPCFGFETTSRKYWLLSASRTESQMVLIGSFRFFNQSAMVLRKERRTCWKRK